ncbi:Lissencephaly-1 homolog B [Strongyloides ratti]|uniref:Lissencephaly-1 homolog B n=1 Tax=Strongyloides ratti TaxID=34506 RepID=A0A090MYD3_STRRB|nr:Lissencephaly-1 homolog B [Strongyloides ratti]CEF66984.1 Lissencephaly-1 homolog B [Strongyloides ratti]
MSSIIRSVIQQEMLIGKVINLSKIGLQQVPCVQVRCQQNEFNDYIKKYHVKSYDYWALDTSKKTRIGDTILIKSLSDGLEKPSINVNHQVDRRIFEFGNVIDPVTGRRVIEKKFFDEIELEKEVANDVKEELDEELPQYFCADREIKEQKVFEEHSKSNDK